MGKKEVQFNITEQVLAFGVRGAFAVARGLENRSYHADFERYRDELAGRLKAQLGPSTLTEDPVLKGFRLLHDAVGRSNKRFPSSAQALVGLFLRRGIIPAINPIVDVYNAVSLETMLSLGAHDLAKIEGDVTLRLTEGGEYFLPMGATAPEKVGAGEYCYMDQSGEVLCRLEFRQAEKTKVTEATRDCFFLIQGNPNTSRAQVENALGRLIELTEKFCGGKFEHAWLVGD